MQRSSHQTGCARQHFVLDEMQSLPVAEKLRRVKLWYLSDI